MDPTSTSQLNNYDKLYLLMAKWKLAHHLFNPFCYVCNIKSISDLEMHLQKNWKHFPKEWLRSWKKSPSFHEDVGTIVKLVADSKSVNFKNLPTLLGIKKNNYKEKLEEAGVLLIPKEQLSLKKSIALGRPYSGDVYSSSWTKPDNTKTDVVLRYDLSTMQRELFMREAKMLCGICHDNIMTFYGAVILGSYADSVGLVVELFNCSNLEEFRVSSSFQAWLFACQLSSALEYLEAKHLVHTSIMEPFIYISSPGKIRIGGFMFCFSRDEIEKAKQSGFLEDMLHSAIIGHQGRRLDDLSSNGVVALFAYIVTSMFRYLDAHCSKELSALFRGNNKWPRFCPPAISVLMERCISDVEARPTFEEIVNVLAKEKPRKLCFTDCYSSTESCELSYEKGDDVWLIDPSRYHGMCFGQKGNGEAGYFYLQDTVPANDRNQVPHEITARGKEAELAYRKALLEGRVQVCRARVLIIGQDRAGKTSLKKSLLGQPFDPNEPSTEGLEVNPSRFEVSVQQVVEWKAVGGEEDDRDQLETIQERNIARLVAINLDTEEAEGAAVQREGRMAEERQSENAHIQEVVSSEEASAGTELPVFAEDVPDGIQLSENDTTPYPPTQGPQPIQMPRDLPPLVAECLRNPSQSSDETGSTRETVLDIWDFAGQHLYYATHPIFFSHRAVYLLAYNLSKRLNDLAEPLYQQGVHETRLSNTSGETNVETLQSWMASVHSIRQPPAEHSYAAESKLQYRPPPVLVVGTHVDKVPTDANVTQIEKQIGLSIRKKAYQAHVLRTFYTVNNTLSSQCPGVKKVRAKVQEILTTGPHMNDDLPVRWLQFEKAVKKLVADGEKFYMRLDEVRHLARKKCFIDDDEQLDAMLNFYHDLGVIVRFKDTVVLSTQWLIDLFRKLITIRPFNDQNPVDGKLWEALENTGILHPQLIDQVFAGSIGIKSPQVQQSILDMMEMYGFVAKFHCHKQVEDQGGANNDVKYFVPAQLTVSPAGLWNLQPRDVDPCPLLFKFSDGFVPHGLFPQLVSRLISRCPDLGCFEQPRLFCNGAQFGLGRRNQFDLILLCSKSYLKIVLKSYDASLPNSSQQEDETVSAFQVRSLIEDELKALSDQWHWLGNVRYEVCVPCVPCQSAGRVKCERRSSAACSHHDCIRTIPVCPDEPSRLLTCSEQIGDRFTLPGLNKWYISGSLEERLPTNTPKFAIIARIDILTLAGDIGSKWKRIGRILGLQDSVLEGFEADKSDLYERCYSMLKTWQQSQGSQQTCERLKEALCHEYVSKNHLVEKYCYSD